MNVLKQVLGIDVAQKELVVTLGRMVEDFSIDLYGYKVFKNNEKGFLALLEWTNKHTILDKKVRFVMEATGVYHEKFAYFLDEKQLEVCVVLPNKISNYMRTLDNKTITDKTCSEAISQFGLERRLELWHRPKDIYKNLQQLTRERDQIVLERAMVKNHLHAEKSEAKPNEGSILRITARIKFLNAQEKEIKEEIGIWVNQDAAIKQEIENICTIPGIGILTAVIILAETNGFELIRSKRQLTSYAGLDVKEKLSGTSIKGKSRISKSGNRHLRKAMHLPGLTAVRWNDNFRNLYARLVSRHGIKMKAMVAVQRKLLEMVYTIFKSKCGYDKEYEAKKSEQKNSVHAMTA